MIRADGVGRHLWPRDPTGRLGEHRRSLVQHYHRNIVSSTDRRRCRLEHSRRKLLDAHRRRSQLARQVSLQHIVTGVRRQRPDAVCAPSANAAATRVCGPNVVVRDASGPGPSRRGAEAIMPSAMSIAKVAQVGELPLALLILGGASGETTGRPALIMGRAPGRAIKVDRLADATGTAKLLQGFEALRFVSRAVAPGDGGGRSIRRCRWWWSLGDRSTRIGGTLGHPSYGHR